MVRHVLRRWHLNWDEWHKVYLVKTNRGNHLCEDLEKWVCQLGKMERPVRLGRVVWQRSQRKTRARYSGFVSQGKEFGFLVRHVGSGGSARVQMCSLQMDFRQVNYSLWALLSASISRSAMIGYQRGVTWPDLHFWKVTLDSLEKFLSSLSLNFLIRGKKKLISENCKVWVAFINVWQHLAHRRNSMS